MRLTETKHAVLIIIPARGGSKSIHHKNIQPLAGKPLLAHTIEKAHQSTFVTRIVVSTDDPQIATVARDWGAEALYRPPEISGDTATSESALLHALDYLEETEGYCPDLVVFLQCTSPIRASGDIDGAIRTLLEEEADSLLSVVPAHMFLWSRSGGEAHSLNYDYQHRPRRQDREPEYRENGSIYVLKPSVLRQFNNRLGGKIALYEMDEWSSVDIDTWRDLQLCEQILALTGHEESSESENTCT